MSFTSELHHALEVEDRQDATTAVHELVAAALHRLDPGAEIKRTDYFTHTFVPDLVIRWGPNEQRRERHVHLRFNVSRPAFAEDLDLLGRESPLFLGMTDPAQRESPPWAKELDRLSGTLVTKSQAVDELEDAAAQDARSRRATGPIVRIGHGVLDETGAGELASSYVRAVQAAGTAVAETQSAQAAVNAALDILRRILPEEGQLDIERALQSEWIRHGGDPYEFPGSTPWNAELLDTEARREVLLGLLDSRQPVAPETWQRNAGFIRAEDIGRVLGRPLRGGSFNAMVHALLPNWTAKWVWAERTDSPSLFQVYDWIIENEILGLETDDLRTYFADDGRHFKDKEGGNPLPALSQAQDMLSLAGVQQVGLRGNMEGIRYEPLGVAGHVYNRIQHILSAPGASTYKVQSLVTQVPGTDAVADVDLDRQIMDLRGQSTPIAALARLAARLFSRSTRMEGIDHFLATGEPIPTI